MHPDRRDPPGDAQAKVVNSEASQGTILEQKLRLKGVHPEDTQSEEPDDGFSIYRGKRQRQKNGFNNSERSSAAAKERQQVYSENKTQDNRPTPEKQRHQSILIRKYPKHEFRPGLIVRGLVHEENYNTVFTRPSETDVSIHTTRWGSICPKWRPMIVLALYENHYTAVPMYTHRGKGIANKRAPEEYVSVKDCRIEGEQLPQGIHGWLDTENIVPLALPYPVTSTAHIPYPLSRKYDLPVAREGHLSRDSLKFLIDLYRDYAPEPLPRIWHGLNGNRGKALVSS
ncbi:MAG: hypothetical protein L6R37_004335 [Teloschistes peruensis]|nr:MAG: hypothetical protein L6R37_004335 [Teloschistes peruensis]